MPPSDASFVAIFAFLAVALWPSARDCAAGRLASLAKHGVRRLPAIGIAQTIAAMSAAVRNGATVARAFEEQAGRRFATTRVTEARAVEALSRRADGRESKERVRAVAGQLRAACTLSERLGCEASRCLEAVGASYRRERLADDRRREAKAGPEATVRLLTGLPILTVMLGEAIGAHPVQWLLGSPVGWGCLAFGLMLYAAGMVWMRRLLGSMEPAKRGRG
ncbi:type II secretion system F family protein [Bifidobacterium avesanii]|uniref:Pilus assembly protein n=1 Tax=Bifidobacterium avesanii TaxID=1798157 RepID=A0A7K3TFB0_9BIFI|nr:pilus assembly protein [Bifidobacterium avesanii]KAB8294398.1 pilus assembly protein [Bifidobacterium avesanii]NEG77768.1 pilus assembly protein [Bifidobacterium avesanii]